MGDSFNDREKIKFPIDSDQLERDLPEVVILDIEDEYLGIAPDGSWISEAGYFANQSLEGVGGPIEKYGCLVSSELKALSERLLGASVSGSDLELIDDLEAQCEGWVDKNKVDLLRGLEGELTRTLAEMREV